MSAFIIITGTMAVCALLLFGAMYLSKVPLWHHLSRRYPLIVSGPTAYSIQDANTLIYDDSTGYGIKSRIRIAVESECLFIALQPVGFDWLDKLPPLQLPLGDISSDENTLRCGDLRIVLRSGGTIFRWKEVIAGKIAS